MREQYGYERGMFPVWTLSGVGFDRLALNTWAKPEIGPNQVLARREVCTICYSSVKEILSGSDHPRLTHIDLVETPIILGDEAYIVLEKVGRNLQDRFLEGGGYAVVPDFGRSAFGYDVPGGLTRYSIIEGRILDYLIPVDMESVHEFGMFGVSLSEPIACCEKSLTLSYRTTPKAGGVMLIVSDGSPGIDLRISGGLERNPPSKIVVAKAGTRLRESIEKLTRNLPSRLIFTEQNVPDARTRQFSPGGWDDLCVVTCNRDMLAEWVREGLGQLAHGGIMALLCDVPPRTPIELELGTYHYDDTLVVGTTDYDLTSAYMNNSDFRLRPVGTAAFVGAGGPMGHLSLLWAMALGTQAPRRLLAIDTLDDRLEHLQALQQYAPAHCTLECINAREQEPDTHLKRGELDYLMMLAPDPGAMKRYLPYLADKAVINLFAGLRSQYVSIDAHDICARGVRMVGHSGDDIPSQRSALNKILNGQIRVEPVVAAVGGADAAWDGLWSSYMGSYPGKIAIYMGCKHQLVPVPTLTGGAPWTAEAERRFIECFRWGGRM